MARGLQRHERVVERNEAATKAIANLLAFVLLEQIPDWERPGGKVYVVFFYMSHIP
jgi:hypothetical protein